MTCEGPMHAAKSHLLEFALGITGATIAVFLHGFLVWL